MGQSSASECTMICGFGAGDQAATVQGLHADTARRARFAGQDASPHLFHQALLDGQTGRANPLGEPCCLYALSPCSGAAEPAILGCIDPVAAAVNGWYKSPRLSDNMEIQ